MVRCTVDNQALGYWEALYNVKYELDEHRTVCERYLMKPSVSIQALSPEEQSDTDDQEHVDAHATP